MLIYYDATDGKVTYSMNCDPNIAPAGDRIEVPDDTDISRIEELWVVDGELFRDGSGVIPEFRMAVNTKRAEIIEAGIDVSAVDYPTTVALQGRPEDQSSMQGLAFAAKLQIDSGDTTTPINFMDRENVLHQFTPAQMIEVWQKGAAFISAIYAKSWEIKEMDPTTTDINDPTLWETTS